jgi:hypothetical protein
MLVTHLYFPLSLFTAGLKVLEQQLILSDALDRFDEICRNRVLNLVLLLKLLKKGTSMLH